MRGQTGFRAVPLLAAQQLSGAADTKTKYVDLTNKGSLMIVANIGATGGSSPTVAIKLQEASATPAADASYADVAAGDIGVTTLTSAAANTLVYATYKGSKPYVRAFITVGGSNPTAYIAVDAIIGDQTHEPPTTAVTGTSTA